MTGNTRGMRGGSGGSGGSVKAASRLWGVFRGGRPAAMVVVLVLGLGAARAESFTSPTRTVTITPADFAPSRFTWGLGFT